jgi:hypothetical protein
MIHDLIKAIDRLLERGLEALSYISCVPCWEIVAAILISGLILITSPPPYEKFKPDDPGRWDLQALAWKLHHPFSAIDPYEFKAKPEPTELGSFHHLEKRTFRITVPLFAYLFSLSLWDLVIVQHVVAVLFIFLSIKLASRLSRDAVVGLLNGVAFGFMFVGQWGFEDFQPIPNYDGIAYFLMLVAMYSRRPWVICLALTLACFTDERAFINAPLVIAYWCLGGNQAEAQPLAAGQPTHLKQAAAVALALVSYLVLRLFLGAVFGLSTGTEELFNRVVLKYNSLNLPLSLPLLWKGYWVIVVIGIAILYKTGHGFWLLFLGCCLAVSLLTSLAVIDFTRSAAYSFPLLWICFKLLAANEPVQNVRKLMVLVALVNIVFPTQQVMLFNEDYWREWLDAQH